MTESEFVEVYIFLYKAIIWFCISGFALVIWWILKDLWKKH